MAGIMHDKKRVLITYAAFLFILCKFFELKNREFADYFIVRAFTFELS